jgi:seryl-tRNA synthetase
MSIDLQAAVPDMDEPLDQTPKEENQLFTFTGKEVMENQLNHIRALHTLETEVAEMKYSMEEWAKRHAAEIAKKDDEYVELLIKVRQTEQQLKDIKGELGDVKEELGVMVATLIQFQHKHYEATHKHDNGFWSSFSYF